jgi:hypothetical protein
VTIPAPNFPATAPARGDAWQSHDQLAVPLRSAERLWRNSDVLEATQPQSVVHFDAAQLKRGWWRLECSGRTAGSREVVGGVGARREGGSGARALCPLCRRFG